jgi:hypothetical protein
MAVKDLWRLLSRNVITNRRILKSKYDDLAETMVLRYKSMLMHYEGPKSLPSPQSVVSPSHGAIGGLNRTSVFPVCCAEGHEPAQIFRKAKELTHCQAFRAGHRLFGLLGGPQLVSPSGRSLLVTWCKH